MSFRIQNNISAMNSLRNLNRAESDMGKSLQRLSSGYRINSAADDAAGMASSMRFRGEISSLKQASRNASEATSLLQVAEGAIGEINLILNRMKELATQAASGNAGNDLAKIQAENTQLIAEIDRISGFTEYNGASLLNGSYGSVSLSTSTNGFTNANGVEKIDVTNARQNSIYYVSAVSATAKTMTISEYDSTAGATTTSQTVDLTDAMANTDVNTDVELNFGSLGLKVTVNADFDVTDYTAGDQTSGSRFDTQAALGQAAFQIGHKNDANSKLQFNLSDVSASGLSVDTASLASQSSAQSALTSITNAIDTLSSRRGDIGALMNRLSYAQSNLASTIENKTASDSVIRDVDMAGEMSTFTKNQILVQAGTAMLAQANQTPQNVLSLIR